MKHYCTFLILTLILISCCPQTDIEVFNEFIGHEKSSAFNNLVNSFDRFLQLNFNEVKSKNERIILFLEHFRYYGKADSSWVFETSLNKEIYNSLESSGMRIEIVCNGWEEKQYLDSIVANLPIKDSSDFEEFELIEELTIEDTSTEEEKRAWYIKDSINNIRVNNIFRINSFGGYINGVELISNNDLRILSYVQAVRKNSKMRDLGDLAGSFLADIENFDTPLMVRIVLVEFYLDLMKENLNKK